MLHVTDLKTKEYVWTWKIKNFLNIRLFGDSVTSTPFNCGDNNEICMSIKVTDVRHHQYVGICPFISRCEADALVIISLITSDNRRITTLRLLASEIQNSQEEQGGSAIKKSIILDENNKLLPDDTLTIVCRVCFRTTTNTGATNNAGVQLAVQPANLPQQANNHACNDFTLTVDGRRFPVDTRILSARSPVFADIFHRVRMNPNANQLELENIDADVLDEVLRYIYTGRIERLERLAIKLFKAAEDYQLEDLRQLTLATIIVNLDLENIGNVLRVMERYDLHKLKPHVLDFVAKHTIPLSLSETFKNCLRDVSVRLNMEITELMEMTLLAPGYQ